MKSSRLTWPILSLSVGVILVLLAAFSILPLSLSSAQASSSAATVAPERALCAWRSFTRADEGGGDLSATSGFISGSSSRQVSIPDNNGWAGSPIEISGAPPDALVTVVDITVVIRHTFIGDLVVEVANSSETRNIRLWDRQGGNAQDINRTWYKLSGFNGLPVNDTWVLWVMDAASGDIGYIESWSITIYYMIPTPSPTPTCVVTPPSPYLALVNAAGSDYTDSLGQAWLSDRQFRPCTAPFWGAIGGQTYATLNPIDGTQDDTLYQSHRYFASSGRYLFQVPNGVFDVQLRFAETYPWTISGSRVFAISIQGQVVEPNLDVYLRAGGPYRALDLTFSTVVTDGRLTVDFIRLPDQGAPIISGILVRQTGAPPTATPTRTPTATPTVAPGRYVRDVTVSSDTMSVRCDPPGTNGSLPEVRAGATQSLRGWFKFDIANSGIPRDAEVSAAELYLWRLSGGDLSLSIFAPLADWAEDSLSWNTQPPHDQVAVASRWIPGGNPAYASWDITGLVSRWLRGLAANNGIMITDDNESATAAFASRENTIVSRPGFIRVYYVVGEPAQPTASPTAVATISPTPSTTGTPIVSPTMTRLPSATATSIPSVTMTATASPSPTQVHSPLNTPTPTATASPVVRPLYMFYLPIIIVNGEPW